VIAAARDRGRENPTAQKLRDSYHRRHSALVRGYEKALRKDRVRAVRFDDLSSMRPNRSSLRGAYGCSPAVCAPGGPEYVFRLNAAHSIPRGSELMLSFRAIG
jgi:hypothetical protein